MDIASSSPGLARSKLPIGLSRRSAAATPPRAVAKSPGRSPPNHAEIATARMKGTYAARSPRMLTNARRNALTATTAATATAYLATVETRVRRFKRSSGHGWDGPLVGCELAPAQL